ncbi:acetate--CoA ligase family protein [Candidatus Nanosalina sp. VS9-1]|uniref:acetate--CoA ligase family protein n=1 Tax=Candidatus Nanosalina sp. VS9-1 TaxID=3388566 RepID=UPI0039E083FB
MRPLGELNNLNNGPEKNTVVTLENLFEPETVAVVGASRHEGKTGHEIFDNLLHGFEGEVYPVNPNADEVEGEEAYDELRQGTDLAVVAVPARLVPDVIRDCGEKKVDTAVVISAGFSEMGNEALESELEYVAEQNDVKILGPNVLGLINTENSMNASFASGMPEPGDISFMSQSGAFCTAMLDYSRPENIGFHHFVSLGNEMMIDEIDLLEKWREDDTQVVLSYIESIDNGREFIEKAIETSREKPVIAVKAGRTEKGGEAASSHTGSMAGSIEAYRAAFRKTGIIEAESNSDLLEFGKAFSFQPLPDGENVAIVTNAGGPGVIASDEINERGLSLAEFSGETKNLLDERLPDEASARNPVDIIGDAGHRRYTDAFDAVVRDENVDSVLVVLTPQANTQIAKTARNLAEKASETDKTVVACFMGEEDVEKGRQILEERGVPVCDDPADSVKSLAAMNSYREFLLSERTYSDIGYDREAAEQAMENLEGFEKGRNVLEAYGINTALTDTAGSPEEAVRTASRIGYPVTLKIDSPEITHKSDVDGVKTDLRTRKDVQKAFRDIMEKSYTVEDSVEGVKVQEQVEGLEVALGMKRDSQFGPMIMVGLGGIYVEALEDISFGIAPISEQEAEQMIEELQSSELFKGIRGQKHSMEPVKDAIIRLGQLALNHEEVSEIDLNPLVLKRDEAYVVDIEFVTDSE